MRLTLHFEISLGRDVPPIDGNRMQIGIKRRINSTNVRRQCVTCKLKLGNVLAMIYIESVQHPLCEHLPDTGITNTQEFRCVLGA